jgi:hypothetical protein
MKKRSMSPCGKESCYHQCALDLVGSPLISNLKERARSKAPQRSRSTAAHPPIDGRAHRRGGPPSPCHNLPPPPSLTTWPFCSILRGVESHEGRGEHHSFCSLRNEGWSSDHFGWTGHDLGLGGEEISWPRPWMGLGAQGRCMSELWAAILSGLVYDCFQVVNSINFHFLFYFLLKYARPGKGIRILA